MTFFRAGIATYSGLNPASTSTPSLFLGRSRICPIEATTRKPEPRYLLIVRALAGDSTMTNDFAILPLDSPLPYHHSQDRLKRPPSRRVMRPSSSSSSTCVESAERSSPDRPASSSRS